jgi:4'-phosphopantetheinyl transferase
MIGAGAPTAGVVHILTARPSEASDYEWMLSGEELARAAGLSNPWDAARAIVSAGLLRRAVALLTGTPASLVDVGRWCRVCSTVGDHGRPVAFDPSGHTIPRVHLSSAHAGEVVLAAASAAGPVGVDVEPTGRGDFDGFDESSLSEEERDLVNEVPPAERDEWRLRIWVRKQAVLKATGHGLSVSPAEFCVAGGHVRQASPRLAEDFGPGVHIIDLTRVPVGHIASAAFLGSFRPIIVLAPSGVGAYRRVG